MIKVGMIVQLWTCATNYGVITKVNRKTFVVEHNLHGRILFKMTPEFSGRYKCKDNCHECTPLSEFNDYIYNHLLYKGRWWDEELKSKVLYFYGER